MDPRRRLLPARESLCRVRGGDAAPALDIAGVDMMLHLINAVDVIRAEVYGALLRSSGLSEGKFTLLMALRDRMPGSVRLSAAAESLGVSNATVTIMTKRMLREAESLIESAPDPEDKRAVTIRLSPAGAALLDRVLPEHFRRVAAWASPLDEAEREALIALVRKLMTGRAEAPPQEDAGAAAL